MERTLHKTVPVSQTGRMNLPAEMRRALGLSGKGHLLLTLVGDEIRVTTATQALRHVRELASPYKPKDNLASEQLIDARHRETIREDSELQGHSHD